MNPTSHPLPTGPPENQSARIGVIDTHRLGELRERFPQMSARVFGPPGPTPEALIAARLQTFIKQGPK